VPSLFHAAPAHASSAPCNASNCAPAPSVATRARSAATSCSAAPVKSRSTCQRIQESESNSQLITESVGATVDDFKRLFVLCIFLETCGFVILNTAPTDTAAGLLGFAGQANYNSAKSDMLRKLVNGHLHDTFGFL